MHKRDIKDKDVIGLEHFVQPFSPKDLVLESVVLAEEVQEGLQVSMICTGEKAPRLR